MDLCDYVMMFTSFFPSLTRIGGKWRSMTVKDSFRPRTSRSWMLHSLPLNLIWLRSRATSWQDKTSWRTSELQILIESGSSLLDGVKMAYDGEVGGEVGEVVGRRKRPD